MSTETPLRLLQILPRLDADGASRNAIDMTRTVIGQGGAVIAAARTGALVGEFRQAGGVHLDLPFESLSPLARWRIARQIRSTLGTHRIDVIHAYGRRGARIARGASRATGIPFVVSPIGNDDRPPEQWISPDMGMANAIVAGSPFVASLVPQTMLANGARVEVIPRGVDLPRFSPAMVRAEKLIRQAQEWRADDLPAVILMPGRLSPGKGHDILLRAMAQMKTRHATCLILSREDENPRYRETLLRLIASLQLEGRVRFVNHAPDMPVAYMIADAVVVPSRVPEAFNSVCAEALAMGRPVVATAVGDTPGMIVPGKTGWLVPPGDAEALAASLDEALALGTPARAALAAQARAAIERGYSLADAQQHMLALYRDLTRPRRP